MPWILVIVCGVSVGVVSIWLGVLPPLNATTLISIRRGQVRLRKGQLRVHAKEDVSDILREAGVSRGFIAITAQNRVVFSRRIPSTIHQRLRNVLLNQWA
jgi:hypothetical protein